MKRLLNRISSAAAIGLLAVSVASAQSGRSLNAGAADAEGTIFPVTAWRTDEKKDPIKIDNLFLYENGVEMKIKNFSYDPSPAKIAILAKALGGANDLPKDAIEKLINIREKAGYLKENARCQACGYLHEANISCDLDVQYPNGSAANGQKVSFTREELIDLLSQAAGLG